MTGSGENRELLDAHKICGKIMASPGAGRQVWYCRRSRAARWRSHRRHRRRYQFQHRCGLVAKQDVPVVQINTAANATWKQCRYRRAEQSAASGNRPAFDRKCRNLVCPAEFTLGEHLKVLIASVPEATINHLNIR